MADISVVVPIYNSEKYLIECLESIVHQTLRDIEIILVDDGSTDASYEICEEYRKKDNRIRTLQQNNSGVWSARNAGLKIATGNYIGFVDSDDYIELDMYEKMYLAATKNDIDIVMCQTTLHNRNGHKTYSYTPFKTEEILNRELITGKVLPLLLASEKESEVEKRLLVPMWCRIFKKEFMDIHDIKFKNFRNGQDELFTVEATCKANKMIILNEYLYNYRNDIGITLSKGYTEDRFDRLLALRSAVEETIKSNGLYNKQLELSIKQIKRRSVFSIIKLIVSKGNNQSLKDKFKELKKLLNRKETIEAFQDVDLSEMKLEQKLLYVMIKQKMKTFLYLCVVLRNKLKEKV